MPSIPENAYGKEEHIPVHHVTIDFYWGTRIDLFSILFLHSIVARARYQTVISLHVNDSAEKNVGMSMVGH